VVLNFDGLLVNNDFGELDEILPAYGVTTHKSQGSEYPAVVIPLSTQHTIRCYGAISSTRELRRASGWWVLGGAAKSVGNCGQGCASRTQMIKTESMATWRSHARGVNNALLFRLD